MRTRFGGLTGTLISLLATVICTGVASAGISVLTEQYDNSRTGADLNETLLNPSSVSPSTFGKLWAYTVSGSVQAQPLYVANQFIPGYGARNVLYIATMNDVVYAFDADSRTVLWSVNLGAETGSIPVPISAILGSQSASGENIVGNVGIESTPQIDISTRIMYLVARTMDNASTCAQCAPTQRLHALDIMTGAEKFGGPVLIGGSVPGSGDGSSTVVFNPLNENQRSSLALPTGRSTSPGHLTRMLSGGTAGSCLTMRPHCSRRGSFPRVRTPPRLASGCRGAHPPSTRQGMSTTCRATVPPEAADIME